VIAIWMLYCLGIGLAFVVVGHALERGLHLAGRPTRWAWVVALAGSYLVPAAAWLRPDAFASFAAPIPVAVVTQQPAPSVTTSTILDQPPSRSFSLADLDLPLRWGWGLASVAILVTLAVATTRLVSLRRRWRQATVDGRWVLVSRNVGPAVVGIWSPRVVLPEWALVLPASDRELMLAHEEQHLRAADPAVLAAGFVLVLLAPWNLALWWQWRRLRLTVEMDCDARVLAEGRSAPAYGELLLHVGSRRSEELLGAAAFGEPRSVLESRIRRIFTVLPRWRWAGVAAALVVAAGAIGGACKTPRPLAPSETIARQTREVMDRVALQQAERLRPWVESNARRMFPSILEPSGPPMDAILVHDARLQVYRGTLTTLNYLGEAGARPDKSIDVAELKEAVPSFDPGHDGWGVVDPRALHGLVRDNVRVIWIHHDPQPQDTAQGTPGGLDSAEVIRRAERVRRLARQYHPEVFGRGTAPTAVALVMDARGSVLGHAARTRYARGADVRTVDSVVEDCLEVLTRLVPRFKDAQWSQSGCTNDPQPNVVIYWGIPLVPLNR